MILGKKSEENNINDCSFSYGAMTEYNKFLADCTHAAVG